MGPGTVAALEGFRLGRRLKLRATIALLGPRAPRAPRGLRLLLGRSAQTGRCRVRHERCELPRGPRLPLGSGRQGVRRGCCELPCGPSLLPRAAAADAPGAAAVSRKVQTPLTPRAPRAAAWPAPATGAAAVGAVGADAAGAWHASSCHAAGADAAFAGRASSCRRRLWRSGSRDGSRGPFLG